jgi:hypothetical protein
VGRLNTPEERERTVADARKYVQSQEDVPKVADIGDLRRAFDRELKHYFALAALSRSKSSPKALADSAHSIVFSFRVFLERRLSVALRNCGFSDPLTLLQMGCFYGFSKKQGTSVRMPLTTCKPTKLCAGACYAHDVLDAAPASVIRGVINGIVAEQFEHGPASCRESVMLALRNHSKRAIQSSLNEVRALKGSGWTRRAFIRFSHVGEITKYPEFANALAEQVHEHSGGRVDCVVYTRHSNAAKLDPKRWVVNFTLDPASLDRRKWVPEAARIVFSAFGGVTSDRADVNFLEHHRHTHMARTAGSGRICPATLPETKERTCDACRCDRCFVAPSK